jgi:hypothetical protein
LIFLACWFAGLSYESIWSHYLKLFQRNHCDGCSYSPALIRRRANCPGDPAERETAQMLQIAKRANLQHE